MSDQINKRCSSCATYSGPHGPELFSGQRIGLCHLVTDYAVPIWSSATCQRWSQKTKENGADVPPDDQHEAVDESGTQAD